MSESGVSQFRIQLLGTPAFNWLGQPFALVRRQARALIFYLATSPHAVSRNKLLYLFWPDEPEAKARRNLTRLVSYMRKELPHPEILFAAGESLRLNPEWVDVDLRHFTELCAQDVTREEAVALYRGPFLMGFSLGGSPEFDFWLTEEGGRYEALYLKTLAGLVRDKTEQAEIADAIHYAQQYLRTDELAEEIHRSLITLHAANGDRAAALQQFETCVEVLERELGVSPLPETRSAYEAAQQGVRTSIRVHRLKPVWTVLPSLDLPLIGRDAAWDALSSAYRQIHTGGVILISGEAGIGKTRLMQEFAMREPHTVLVGDSHPSTQTLPYQPLVQALRLALTHPSLWKDISSLWLGELSQLLPELRDHFPDLPRPLAVEPQQARARLREALTRVFLGLADPGVPLLLCLDDLHWTDEATLGWLSAVSLRLKDSRLCILGTYRQEEPDAVQGVRRAFRRAGLLVEITLEGLSTRAIRDILAQVPGADPARGALAEHLAHSTGGNTFFVLESVRALLESGELDEPLERLPLPKSVQETIQARLERLGLLARQILETAAVISRDLEPALLWETAGRTEIEAAHGLDELVRRQLLVEEVEGLAFRHELLRMTVYKTLSPWRRQALHRRIGDALGKIDPRRPETVAVQRAQHYDAAGAYEQAVESYRLAVTTAQAVYAHEEAILHLRRAITLATETKGESTLIANLHEALADSFGFIGHFAEAFEAYQSALDNLPGSGSVERANLLHKQAGTLVPQQKYADAADLFRKTIGYLQSFQESASVRWKQVWFDAHLGLMDALYFQALPEEMLQVSKQIQEELDQDGTPSQRVRFLAILDQAQMRQSRFRPTKANLDRRRMTLEQQKKMNNPVKIADAHFGYAFMLLWYGDFPEAHHHFSEGLAMAEKFAYGFCRAQCLTYLIVLHRLRGQPSRVQEMWPSAHEVAKEVGFPTYIASSMANRAWLNYRKHQWEAAKADAKNALEKWGSSPYPLKWLAYWVLLAVALHENEVEVAVQAGDGMLEPVQQYLSDEVMTTLERASESWKAQDRVTARAFLEKAVKLARESGYL